jgi:hypothetical protein
MNFFLLSFVIEKVNYGIFFVFPCFVIGKVNEKKGEEGIIFINELVLTCYLIDKKI